MTDTFPFSPELLASLARLSSEINGTHAPVPIVGGVTADDGWVNLPVPDHAAPAGAKRNRVECELHAGLTLQWAPLPGGAVVEFRGGDPDGIAERDSCACFLTARGLRGLAKDLTAIADAIGGEA